MTFSNNSCCIYDPLHVHIAKVSMVDNCFPLYWKSVIDFVHVAKTDQTWLSHRGYDHFNLKLLKFQWSNDLVGIFQKFSYLMKFGKVVSLVNCIGSLLMQTKVEQLL